MLTLFAIPKPFHGRIETIQRNAIQSWTLLRPVCEIILFGDEKGTAEVAGEFKVCHIPEVARNEFGTPLVSSLFETTERVAAYDLLCYINADIVLMNDFMKAVQQVSERKRRFLLVGQRWDVGINQLWNFQHPDWQERLRAYVAECGELSPPTGIDYFVFPRGFWGEIPPFAIGRLVWDNWLIYRARSLRAPVVDATGSVLAVHQNHDYAHYPMGKTGIIGGPEAKCNMEIAGGYSHVFTLEDVTHILTPSGPKLDVSYSRLRRHLDTLPILFPRLRPAVRMVRAFGRALRHLRLKLGFLNNWRRTDHGGT